MGEDDLVGFRGPQVCKIVGITYRQLDYWARTDLIRPSLADASGSGSRRLYSYRDLLELRVIKSLLDAGTIEAGRLSMARAPCDVQSQVYSTATLTSLVSCPHPQTRAVLVQLWLS